MCRLQSNYFDHLSFSTHIFFDVSKPIFTKLGKFWQLQNDNQAYSEYKHVLANILRSRYEARTPPLEARSPGRRSNVENASVTC